MGRLNATLTTSTDEFWEKTNVIQQYTNVHMISAIILYQFSWLSLGMQERLFDRRGIAMWSPNGEGDGSEETIYEP